MEREIDLVDLGSANMRRKVIYTKSDPKTIKSMGKMLLQSNKWQYYIKANPAFSNKK